ncbi:hypothetical protein [Nisaea sp.]|uniref:hypothetical protein n=1 Tax=Nisaea sp. TaxID=2024842 RepID=UPI00326627DF
MENEESWRLEYRIRPYLRHAPEHSLKDRLHDIMMNILYLTAEGKIGVKPPGRTQNPWLQKLIDLEHECHVRGLDIQKLSIEDLPYTKNLEIIKKNFSKLEKFRCRQMFCKYGQKKYMESMIKKGVVRVAPASSFSGDGHNVAQKDQELAITTYIGPYDYDLDMIDPYFRNLRPKRGVWEVNHVKPSDYYLYCVSASLDIRMFFDFNCDSCVVIHDQYEFERRLKKAAASNFKNHVLIFDAAKYVDPYFILQRLPADPIFLYFIKHLRFMYQGEYRLVIVSRDTDEVRMLEPVFLEIGNIEDIASLFILEH